MSNLEYEVFKFLYNRTEFKGNYTNLTLAIGQKKPNEPNVRKAVKNLEKKYKIVTIIYAENTKKTHPMESCYLCEGWEKVLGSLK